MCKTITIKEISEDTIYFSSGFSEWYAERLNNGQYELRHMNKRHNSKGKHKAHRQNKMFNDVESIKEFIEKHDFRSVTVKTTLQYLRWRNIVNGNTLGQQALGTLI